MPCDSSYLEQNEREYELQRAAKLLLFCYRLHGVKGVTHQLVKAANEVYCEADYVSTLCEYLTEFQARSPKNFEKFIYNGKDKNCRDLASWWEEHKAADKEREDSEKKAKQLKKIKASALDKLTTEEKKALGF